MRAVLLREFGSAKNLKAEEMPMPQPRAGEVRVKVEAAGLNFTEIIQRRGPSAAPLPRILGSEFAGTVDALGEGVRDFQVGDRVTTQSGTAGYAEYAIAPAQRLVRIPSVIDFDVAVAATLQGMTAHYLAFSTYPLKWGDTALIHAAAGGVGQILVQLAKLCGADVIATVSTDEKARLVSGLGADAVINYTLNDFEAEVKRITEGKGVSVVYDSVGKDTFAKGLNCLRPRGMMVIYGASSGQPDPVDTQTLSAKGSLFLTRPTLVNHVATHAELVQRANDLFDWIISGELKIRVDKHFKFEEAAQAHEYMEGRKTMGKVVLVP